MPTPKQHIDEPPRRTFLKIVTAAASAVAAAMVTIPGVAYLAGAVRRREPIWVRLAAVESYPVNETRLVSFNNPLAQPWDGVTAQTGVYVRNLGRDEQYEERFQVFAVNCTHLGCPVEWFPQSGLFMCPCHGGVYYANGDRASGPPPEGLFQCVWRIRDGLLEVQSPHLPTLFDKLNDRERMT